MGLQKYRADFSKAQPDQAVLWYSDWMGGPSLAKVVNCRITSLQGDMRVTAYTRGEPDTWFSVPAICTLMGRHVNGYLCREDDTGFIVFRHTYY